MNKAVLVFLISMLSVASYAEFPVGEWVGVENGVYTHLKIQTDGSSSLIYSDLIKSTNKFTSGRSDINEFDGFYSINYDAGKNASARLVFSASFAPERPCCLVVGTLYLFGPTNDKNVELINSMPIRITQRTDDLILPLKKLVEKLE